MCHRADRKLTPIIQSNESTLLYPVFFFSREPRKSAREQFRESVREHFASARERLN